jgi:hypothetical protein
MITREPPSRNEKASPVALAVLIGALVLSVAEAFPGGLNGSQGFVLGTLLTLMVIWLSERVGRLAENQEESLTTTRRSNHNE